MKRTVIAALILAVLLVLTGCQEQGAVPAEELRSPCQAEDDPGEDAGQAKAALEEAASPVEVAELIPGELPEEILVGQRAELAFSLKPETATHWGITAKSSDPKIAGVTFEERGDSVVQITGISAGEAEVIFSLPGGAEVRKPLAITERLPEQMELSLAHPERALYVGVPLELAVHWTPEDTTLQEVTWTSDNSDAVRINSEGVPEAVGVGKAALTARHRSGVSARIDLEILPVPVESVELAEDFGDSLSKGDTLTLTAAVLPEDAADQQLIWASGDPSVLRVDQQGRVTAVGEGTAEISVKAGNGAEDRLTLTVESSARPYSFTWSGYMVDNQHVGSNWDYGCELNGEYYRSGTTVLLEPDERISLAFWAQENDSWPDYQDYWDYFTIDEEVRSCGLTVEGTLYVAENGGRYTGNQAIWSFTIQLTPLNP